MISSCPVCGRAAAPPFLDFGRVPIDCTRLYSTQQAARSAPLGEMQLVACSSCTTVYNRAFDAERVQYDGDYENSQFFSGAFRDYAEALAGSLLERHGVDGGLVVEIGSGKGEFLSLLARGGRNRAIGFDPSYRGESDDVLRGLDVEVVPAYFDEGSAPADIDLVCLRHVLEHMAEPVAFLARIRAAMQRSPRAVLYVEVPNSAFTLTASGCWDLIYQHFTYFSRQALQRALETAGFSVRSLEPAFAGQFLAAEASPSETATARPSQQGTNADLQDVARARGAATSALAHWHEFLGNRVGDGVAVWGAGAKGVTFLNAMREHKVALAIDVNPRKTGSFVPGTGQPIVNPGALVDAPIPVETVVLANAIYEAEVRAQLDQLGLSPEVVAL